MASDADRFGFRGTQGRRPEIYEYKPDNYRSDFDGMPGVLQAQRRLATHHGAVYAAFNSLDTPTGVDALLDFIDRPLKACGMPEEVYGKVVGVLLGAIMVAIEADRSGRMDP